MCMGQLCASVSFFVYVIQCYTSTTLKWKSIYASYAIALSCEINHNHVLLFLFIRHTHGTMCQHSNISPKNYWTKKNDNQNYQFEVHEGTPHPLGEVVWEMKTTLCPVCGMCVWMDVGKHAKSIVNAINKSSTQFRLFQKWKRERETLITLKRSQIMVYPSSENGRHRNPWYFGFVCFDYCGKMWTVKIRNGNGNGNGNTVISLLKSPTVDIVVCRCNQESSSHP